MRKSPEQQVTEDYQAGTKARFEHSNFFEDARNRTDRVGSRTHDDRYGRECHSWRGAGLIGRGMFCTSDIGSVNEFWDASLN